MEGNRKNCQVKQLADQYFKLKNTKEERRKK